MTDYERGYKDGMEGAALPNIIDNGAKIDGYVYSYKTDSEGVPYINIDSVRAMLSKATDVKPVDKDSMHIIYIGRKAYMAENTIMEFMKKMDIIRDSLAHIENYFDTYAETIRQINACVGRCTDITEVKYFIDKIKENCRYD